MRLREHTFCGHGFCRFMLMSFISMVPFVAGCASRSPNVPFAIPREEFLGNANTIAIAPVLAPAGVEVSEWSLESLDHMIEQQLSEVGYACVTANQYSEVWDRIVAQAGGVYDTDTGEPDELKLETAQEQLRLDLIDLYHPDYVLFPEIWVVEAGVTGGVAKWDGTSQAVESIGWRILNAIDAVLNQYDGFLEPGIVGALSLGVVVEDLEGREIFQNAGGLEILKELEDDENSASERFELPLGDPERTLKAVKTALRPMLEDRSKIRRTATNPR